MLTKDETEKGVALALSVLDRYVDLKECGNGVIGYLKSSGRELSGNSLLTVFAHCCGMYIDPDTGEAHWINGDKIEKNFVDRYGYRYFWLRIPHLSVRGTVNYHRLGAVQKYNAGDEMFVPGIMVRHLDNNKLNNRLDNLALGTALDNARDIPYEDASERGIKAAATRKRNAELGIAPKKVSLPKFKRDKFPKLTHHLLYDMGVTISDPDGIWGPEDCEVIVVAPPIVFTLTKDLKPKESCYRESKDTAYLLKVAFSYARICPERCIIVVPNEYTTSPIYNQLFYAANPQRLAQRGLKRIVTLQLEDMLTHLQK